MNPTDQLRAALHRYERVKADERTRTRTTWGLTFPRDVSDGVHKAAENRWYRASNLVGLGRKRKRGSSLLRRLTTSDAAARLRVLTKKLRRSKKGRRLTGGRGPGVPNLQVGLMRKALIPAGNRANMYDDEDYKRYMANLAATAANLSSKKKFKMETGDDTGPKVERVRRAKEALSQLIARSEDADWLEKNWRTVSSVIGQIRAAIPDMTADDIERVRSIVAVVGGVLGEYLQAELLPVLDNFARVSFSRPEGKNDRALTDVTRQVVAPPLSDRRARDAARVVQRVLTGELDRPRRARYRRPRVPRPGHGRDDDDDDGFDFDAFDPGRPGPHWDVYEQEARNRLLDAANAPPRIGPFGAPTRTDTVVAAPAPSPPTPVTAFDLDDDGYGFETRAARRVRVREPLFTEGAREDAVAVPRALFGPVPDGDLPDIPGAVAADERASEMASIARSARSMTSPPPGGVTLRSPDALTRSALSADITRGLVPRASVWATPRSTAPALVGLPWSAAAAAAPIRLSTSPLSPGVLASAALAAGPEAAVVPAQNGAFAQNLALRLADARRDDVETRIRTSPLQPPAAAPAPPAAAPAPGRTHGMVLRSRR